MTRRGFVGLAVSLMLSVQVAGLVAPPRAGAEAPVVWGAYPAPRSGESKLQAWQRLEATANRKLGAVRAFYRWNDPWPTAFESAVKSSAEPMIISVKARLANGTPVPWADITAAQPGSALYSQILGWAQRVRDFGVPIYVSFNHEPEAQANVDLGTDTEFVAAWQRWVSIFRTAGATNARFMWVMTDYSFSLPATDRRAAARWYPGDAWVDAIAADAYNWYTCRTGINNAWKTLRDIIDPLRRFWLLHQGEELWLAEYGSVEDPATPGRKAAWFAETRALFKTPEFSVFDGISLFESGTPSSTCFWRPDTSSSALEAWRGWGQDPFYGGPGSDPPPPPPPPTERSALLVVGDPASLGTDATLVARLQSRGYVVTVVDDNVVTTASAAGISIVLISQTVAAATMGSKLRTVTTPVVIWKPSVYDDMSMTVPAANGSYGKTSVLVTLPGHPLAAGLGGTVGVVTANTPLPWGDVTAGATVVATVSGKPTVFGYPAGAAMSGQSAPACRVAIPLHADAVPRLTSAGWAIFDAASDWAATGCPG